MVHGVYESFGCLCSFLSLGLYAKIIDFEGKGRPASEALTDWLRQYFSANDKTVAPDLDPMASSNSRSFEKGASDVRTTTAKSIESQSEPCQKWATTWRNGCAHKQPPVLLQHSTHSRTVVGFLARGSQEYLLMLDPAKYLSAADFDKQSWEVPITDFNTSRRKSAISQH